MSTIEKKRVYEIARALDVETSDLLSVLAEAGHIGLTASSNVAVDAAEAAWTAYLADRGSADASDRTSPEGPTDAATREAGAGGAGDMDSTSELEGSPRPDGSPRFDAPGRRSKRSPSRAKGTVDVEPNATIEFESAVKSGPRYRLVRKGSVRVGPHRVRRGEVVSSAVWEACPARVQAFFDTV